MTSIVHDYGELRELEGEWRALAERRGNVFITPEWFRCWLAHYGDEAGPFVPVLRRPDGTLAGLLPLVLTRPGRRRVLRLAGSSLGDRFHPVCDPDDEVEVARSAGAALASSSEDWSALALERADCAQPWVSALRDGAGIRLHSTARTAADLPQIDLARYGSWEQYLASRSKNLRQQIRRVSRRTDREHAMRTFTCDDPDQVEEAVAAFFELHDHRWSDHSSLTSPRARAFLTDLAKTLLARDWLRLWFLELDGRLAASWYGWRLGDCYSYYNSGFDPLWSSVSPGLLLMAKVIESAFEEGAARFDMLLGEHRHKLRLADGNDTVSDVTVTRALPHPAAIAASAEHGARWVGRRLPAQLQQRLGDMRLSPRARRR